MAPVAVYCDPPGKSDPLGALNPGKVDPLWVICTPCKQLQKVHDFVNRLKITHLSYILSANMLYVHYLQMIYNFIKLTTTL